MGLAETAELAVRIGLDDRLSPGLAKASGNLNRFSAGLGRAGRGVGQLAGGIARAGAKVAVITAGALTAVAYAAIEFEDAFAGVKKTVDETALAAAGLTFKDLERQFRDMATEIPVAASELARIGEAAGALGIRAQDITEFTEVVAKLGVTTDLTTDEAAASLGKIGTILGLTGNEFEKFADTLVNLGNNGASTESEIIELTKRFAASGKQAGLTTDDILALASATASLGIEPEAGGSALSRLFANMATNISLANDKGKAFSQLVGKPIKELKREIDKGRGLPLFLEMLDKIRGLSRTDAAKTLAALGITNVRDRDAILKLAQNYGFLGEQIDTAKNSTGALSEEAGKRFDTLRSKLTLLKNNVLEAAFTIGGDPSNPKSFIGSIGVAAEKLSAFLKDPANKRELEAFGERLGAAITGIDFDKLLDTAKGVVRIMDPLIGALGKLAEAIGKLPPELVGAGGALLITNHLSGGAVSAGLGNIVGGLGEAFAKSMIAKVPLFGSAFVQPVFVTNMGGLPSTTPGATPGTGSTTGINGLTGILQVAGLATIGAVVAQGIEDGAGAITDAMHEGNKPAQELARSINDLNTKFAFGGFAHLAELPKNIENLIDAVTGGGKSNAPTKNRGRVEGRELRAYREAERETANAVTSHLDGLRAKLAAAINQQGRLIKKGDLEGAQKVGNRVQRLQDRLSGKLNTSNARLQRIANKDLSVKVNVSNPVTVATYVRGVAVSTRYGGNFSVTAI